MSPSAASAAAARDKRKVVIDLLDSDDDEILPPTSTTSNHGAAVDLTQAAAHEHDDEDDEEEVEEEEEDEEEHIYVGKTALDLVGIQYYNGVAHPDEYVQLVREPSNMYDRNAIRIDNLAGEKVGHIKREQARVLAPLMDAPSLRSTLEIVASIPRPGNRWKMPLHVEYYAVAPSAEQATRVALEMATLLDSRFPSFNLCYTTFYSPLLPSSSSSSLSPAQRQQQQRRQQQQQRQYNRNSRPRYTTPSPAASATSRSATSTTTSPPPPEPVVVVTTSKTMDWSKSSKELDAMFDKQSQRQLQDLPPVEIPSQLCSNITLFDHQRQGIQWLVRQETAASSSSEEPSASSSQTKTKQSSSATTTSPFFKQVQENGVTKWLCDITQSSQDAPPKPNPKGGILADEMGLGKTLQTIGLILAAPPVDYPYPPGRENDGDEEAATSTAMQVQKEPAVVRTGRVCTLIVCPVSVMSNWDQQIKKYVKEGVLRVEIFQGPRRTQQLYQPLQDGQIDVLLVSYHTLAADYDKAFGKADDNGNRSKKKNKMRSIFNIPFHRIVLDEAHTVRSSKTNFFRAVCNIDAERKLALTGTPFVNKPADCQSLLAFLGVEPLDDPKIFRRAISNPIQNNDEIGMSRLRAVMGFVCLRRSKAMANIQMVEKEVTLRSVSFASSVSPSSNQGGGQQHKDVYDALFGTFRTAFEAVLQDGEDKALKNYSSIFEKLMRMRQACCSAALVPPNRREIALKVWNELQSLKGEDQKLTMTAEEGMKLLETLKGAFSPEADDDEMPECSVCFEELNPDECIILKTCQHIFCESCIGRVVQTKANCPLCRITFRKGDMVKKNVASEAAAKPREEEAPSPSNKALENDDFSTSPKVLALLDAIKNVPSDEKGVIFSQFTSFLDIVGDALDKHGYSFTRIDGSMNSRKRIEAVSSLNSDAEDSPRFILCSLHAAGVGINLTRANWAFMLDVWWNSSVENQAMDRIHRLDQTRKVNVIRFVMKDSIEERIVALQQAKDLQAKGALEKLKPEEKRKARVSDLKGLLLLDN